MALSGEKKFKHFPTGFELGGGGIQTFPYRIRTRRGIQTFPYRIRTRDLWHRNPILLLSEQPWQMKTSLCSYKWFLD
jgi:hypothetical protein